MFHQGLSRARAPGPGWVVTMRVESKAGHVLHADGIITDDAAHAIAQRELTGSTGNCQTLAEALGVWAALVLDAEVARSEQPPAAPPLAASPAAPAPAVPL